MDPFALTTLAALAVAAALVALCVRTDVRHRRIPNGAVAALAGTWLLWRLALGALACWEELAGLLDSSFPLGTRFLMGAWDARPLGLPSAADGLLAAAMFGIGLLVLALAFEAAFKREALGGGDVKLMAALALFMGPGRSALCLLAACVAALAWQALCRVRRPRKGTRSQAAPSPPGAFPFAPALAFGAAVAVVPGIVWWLAA